MTQKFNHKSQITEFVKTDARAKKLMSAMNVHQKRPDAIIEILHIANDLFGYLPLNLLTFISKEMKVPPSRIYGIATFYNFFSLKPKGEHTCLVCTGTACYVKGSHKVLENIEKHYSVKAGDTTRDNKLGLQIVRCLGACGLAPAVVMDDEILAKVDAGKIIDLIDAKIGEKQ